MKSILQSNCLRYATFLLVCCSLIIAQPPIIQPTSFKMKTVTIEECTVNSALRSQVANKVEESLNSSVVNSSQFCEVGISITTGSFLPPIQYGMARAALAPVPAVDSTTLHGSVSS